MKTDLIKSIIFFIIALVVYLYIKYNNNNNEIDFYYLNNSNFLHKLFKINCYFINMVLMYNFK
jgi:hypothetical protein